MRLVNQEGFNCLLKGVKEFDFRVLGDGRSASARYANNSNYRNDSLIRKESGYGCVSRSSLIDKALVCVSSTVISEIKRIVKESEIMKSVRYSDSCVSNRY